MKKAISLFLFVVMLFSSIPTFATENKESIIYDTVTETAEGFLFTKTDVVRANRSDNRTIENKTYMMLIPTSEEYRFKIREDLNNLTRGTLRYNYNDWDETSSFLIEMQIVVDTINVNGIPYGKIISASGGFSGATGTTGNYVGSGIYVHNHSVEAKILGVTIDHEPIEDVDTMYVNSSTRTWNYMPPTNWDYLMIENDSIYLQVLYSVVAGRGTSGSTWTTTVGRNFV